MLGGQVNKIVNYTWRFTGADQATRSMSLLRTAAAGASIAVVGALAAITKSAVGVASAFIEMENQFNVVFGSAAPQARAELDAFAESIGRSGNRMMGYAAAIQDTFVPLGLAREQAADLSIAAVQLATDLSSFKNLGMEETVTSITAALAGQHRSVQRLGIVIRESTLNQELMNMGIEGGYNAATEAEKAIARYNLMVAASQDAMGDATRTSGEFENQVRVLEDAWYDTRIEIGEKVIPIIQDFIPDIEALISDFGEMASEAIPRVIESLAKLAPALLEVAGFLGDMIGLLGTAADGWMRLTEEHMGYIVQAAGGGRGFEVFTETFTPMLVDAAQATAVYNEHIEHLIALKGKLLNQGVVDEEQIVVPGSGSGTQGEPEDPVKEAQKYYEEILKISGVEVMHSAEALRMAGEKREIILSSIREEEQHALRLQNILETSAANFGRSLRNGGEGMLDIAVQIGLEFAKIKLGESFASGFGGGVFSFLGGFF
jgi:hypothetical protein